MNCPYCKAKRECETVDIGVGEQQVTPFVCLNCRAEQLSPFHDFDSTLDDEERRTGFYKPISS